MRPLEVIRSVISAVREGVIKRFDAAGRPGETFTDREFFQHYGFTSSPLENAEGLVLLKGNVIYLIATDDRQYRIALQNGEVALYTDEGDKVHLKRGREININSGGKVTVEAPEIDLGDATQANLKRLIDERFKELYDAHIHPVADGMSGPPTMPLEITACATAVTRAK